MYRSLPALILALGCYPQLEITRDKGGTVEGKCTVYADRDGDGFGDEASETAADCDAIEDGQVESAGDCDDTDPLTFPGASEVCDQLDNDCDGEADEDATDDRTWYGDSDGDGYAGELDTVSACEQPEGYSATADDCDDSAATISPGAVEICDELDNDCDGDIDDADAGVDTSGGQTYYADNDSDGYGNARNTVRACAVPSGYLENALDCNDNVAAISPDATEICDDLDNDCDALIDDADASLSGGDTWYADSDSDGFGDSGSTRAACEQPAGYVDDQDDCDDGNSSINPDAQEICDEQDNDCDGAIDDDDSSVDLTTGETWYADDDSDGDGDPDVSLQACDQPSGYVANSDDCDDTTAEDCSDDRDGDGLRNDWDVEPDDASVARGPNQGFGGDGAVSAVSDATFGEWTLLASAAASGATTISVDDASAFAEGDELLVLSQQGTDAGQHQLVFVASVSGSTVTIEPPLADAYSSSSVVLVQRVPHYTTYTATAEITADHWEGAGGGVIAFRATGAVTISGELLASGVGFEGGPSVSGHSTNPYGGESYLGFGSRGDASANEGGGGAYAAVADSGVCGGGGSYGSSGDSGESYWDSSVTDPGDTYGDSALTEWFLGSGGGAGTPDSESDGSSSYNRTGSGGDGGGIIAIWSGSAITISGQVRADGSDGSDGYSWGGELGGGGGGSGGQVLLAAPTVTLSGKVTATGGDGGESDDYGYHGVSSEGGEGGDGRIRIERTSSSGSTDPSASTGSWSK